jgi:recombination protein RecT
MNTTPQHPRPGEHPPPRTNLAAPHAARLSHLPLKQVATLDQLFKNAEFRTRVAESLPRHMTPDRMLRMMAGAIQRAPLLAKADIRSLIGAFLTCSQVGLEPNTPLQHVHLIPFKRTKWNPQTRRREEAGVEVQLIFGYPGLLDLSYRSPLVTSISANVVFAGDDFSFEYGTDAHLRHRPKGAAAARGARPTHAYMMAKLKDGFAFEVMPYEDVLAIRDNSQAYRLALSMKEEAESQGRRLPAAWTEAPWVKHEIAMARKTAFRAGSKWLPRSVELASVIEIDEAQERRRDIEWGTVIDASDGDYVAAAVTAASAPDDDDDGYAAGPAPDEGRQRQAFPGAVFDPPSAAPEPPPPPPPPAQERAREAAPRSRKPSRAPEPPPPVFPHALVDAYGDPAEGNPCAGPVEFAQGYVALWQAADDPAKREALADFNADGLAEAYENAAAAEILAEAAEPDEPAGAAQPGPEPSAPQPMDPDEKWVADLLEDAAKATLEDLRTNYVNNGSIRARVQRIKAERPDLGAKVEAAFAARLNPRG